MDNLSVALPHDNSKGDLSSNPIELGSSTIAYLADAVSLISGEHAQASSA